MIEIYLRFLPPEIKSYKELHRTAYSLLSGAVLNHFGRSITEDDILRTERGKPYFRDIPMHFGISHCTGCAMCAVSDYPVGADCEALRKFRGRTAKYAFTPQEYEFIASSDEPDVTFSRMWSLKESFVKFTGTGLAGHMNDAVFLSCGEIPEAVTGYGSEIAFRCFTAGGNITVSVCTHKNAGDITFDKITIL